MMDNLQNTCRRRSELSAHTELGVYETFEELFGRKTSLDELIADICKFQRNSLLWICAEIVSRVQLWARPALRNASNYQRYLIELFDETTSSRLLAGSQSTSPVRLLFHRRQIVLIAKLAAQHCQDGLDARLNRKNLGLLFLKANDLFDYGLLPGPTGDRHGKEEYMKIVTEMLAVNEGASPDIGSMFTRGHLMIARYAQELSSDPDYVDVAGEFEKTTGMSLLEFEALVFAVHARFGPKFSDQVVREPHLLPLRQADFGQTAVSPEKVDSFLRFFSASLDDIAEEVRKTDCGPNDATVFRKHPMVRDIGSRTVLQEGGGHLMIDNLFFLEKAQTGPYWIANSTHGDKLRRFWGAVFERYVNELLSRACSGTRAKFLPDPRPADDPKLQICDGLIATVDSVVLIEYKSSMFRADKKYSGDAAQLLEEIEKKLVRNKDRGIKKGVQQLAAAVELLFKGSNPQAIVPDIDWKNIKTVHLCVATLDSIGGTIGMSALLNTHLSENLDRSRYPSIDIPPLYCVDIATLERATGYFTSMALSEIFDQWRRLSPDLVASLSMVQLGQPAQNPWLQSEWGDIFRNIVKLLFPNADPEEVIARARQRA